MSSTYSHKLMTNTEKRLVLSQQEQLLMNYINETIENGLHLLFRRIEANSPHDTGDRLNGDGGGNLPLAGYIRALAEQGKKQRINKTTPASEDCSVWARHLRI